MLIVCLVSSAILVPNNDIISSSIDNDIYDSFLFQTFTALWVVIVTGIALIFELIYFVLRFLNIHCYNNCYKLYGFLVKYNKHTKSCDSFGDLFRILSVTFYLFYACCLAVSDMLTVLMMPETMLTDVTCDQKQPVK